MSETVTGRPEGLTAKTITITGHGGEEIEAYLAVPEGVTGFGGVVVIHHMPGYDAPTKEIVRKFAANGYAAICPNLYHREAPGADPDDAAATARAGGGVPDERLVGDVSGAAEYLKSLPGANGKVGVIGYCSGGRQVVLSACNLQLDAAVDCYGAFVFNSPPAESGLKMTSLREQLPNLSAPLLGLFGAEDQFPAPEEVKEFDAELTKLNKAHEFHSYENAGHAFFATNRPSYRPEAANEGWQRVFEFFGTHLGAGN